VSVIDTETRGGAPSREEGTGGSPGVPFLKESAIQTGHFTISRAIRHALWIFCLPSEWRNLFCKPSVASRDPFDSASLRSGCCNRLASSQGSTKKFAYRPGKQLCLSFRQASCELMIFRIVSANYTCKSDPNAMASAPNLKK